MNKTADSGKPSEDWDRFDAMSAAARRTAANADPDAKPLASEDFKRMRRSADQNHPPRARPLAREVFGAVPDIPVGTLRDWEQGRRVLEMLLEPGADLKVIGRNPSAVAEVLNAKMRD